MRLINLFKKCPVRLKFGNRYELSIIDDGYSTEKSPYEIATFRDGEFTEMPGITGEDGVAGFLRAEEVDAIILKMMAVSGCDPEVNTEGVYADE